jgi:hypothetical protein
VLTRRGAMSHENWVRQPLCADSGGFNLHAALGAAGHDHKRLEQLCIHASRPALSDERSQQSRHASNLPKLHCRLMVKHVDSFYIDQAFAHCIFPQGFLSQ